MALVTCGKTNILCGWLIIYTHTHTHSHTHKHIHFLLHTQHPPTDPYVTCTTSTCTCMYMYTQTQTLPPCALCHAFCRCYLDRTCTTALECLVDSMRTFRLSIHESANMSPDLAARTVPRGSFRFNVTSFGRPLLFV